MSIYHMTMQSPGASVDRLFNPHIIKIFHLFELLFIPVRIQLQINNIMATGNKINPQLWEQYQARIEDLYYVQNRTLSEVRYALELDGFKASKASYCRKLALWNQDRPMSQQRVKYQQYLRDEKLVGLVRYYWHRNYSPKSILRIFKYKLGYSDMNIWKLGQIRGHYKLKLRRNQSDHEHIEALEETKAFILKELKSGQSIRYGYNRTHQWVRKNVSKYISRAETRRLLRILDPKGVKARDKREDRKRRRFTVKGPGRYWSCDGHDKLAYYGFQIYGIIDAYSRMIIGVFVGISNRTQIAVLKFYLRCVRGEGYFPKKLRCDKGWETLLMATAQAELRRSEKGEDLPFGKTFTYGPSTKNQRIEMWWNTLASGLTETWRRFFESFHEAGIFDGESKYDLIAIRFIYMEPLRRHIENFVDLHNIYPIRTQRARADYLRAGKPEELHDCHWGVRHYGTHPTGATEELLAEFEEEVSGYDHMVYQTPEIAELCTTLLSEAGIVYQLEELKAGLDQDHVRAYRFLRRALERYEMEVQDLPFNVEPPRGGERWLEAMREAERALQEAIEQDRGPNNIREEDLDSEVSCNNEGQYEDDSGGSENEGNLDNL